MNLHQSLSSKSTLNVRRVPFNSAELVKKSAIEYVTASCRKLDPQEYMSISNIYMYLRQVQPNLISGTLFVFCIEYQNSALCI